VVGRIKAGGSETRILVADKECVEWHLEHKQTISSSLPYVIHLSSQRSTSPVPSSSSSSSLSAEEEAAQRENPPAPVQPIVEELQDLRDEMVSGPPSLSAPVPDDYAIQGAFLLHKLLLEGKGDEVLRRKSELNPHLLSRTFTYYHTQETTPLHIAAWSKSSAEVVSTLIQAGANVDALDGNQQSPLHHASNWNPAVVPVLIGAGCKVNLLDNIQRSPLYYAALSGKDRSAVLALLQAGADPHLGESPFTIICCQHGQSPLTDSLVSDDMKALIKSEMSSDFQSCSFPCALM